MRRTRIARGEDQVLERQGADRKELLLAGEELAVAFVCFHRDDGGDYADDQDQCWNQC
jgi:hypothetical protein